MKLIFQSIQNAEVGSASSTAVDPLLVLGKIAKMSDFLKKESAYATSLEHWILKGKLEAQRSDTAQIWALGKLVRGSFCATNSEPLQQDSNNEKSTAGFPCYGIRSPFCVGWPKIMANKIFVHDKREYLQSLLFKET